MIYVIIFDILTSNYIYILKYETRPKPNLTGYPPAHFHTSSYNVNIFEVITT